MLGMSTYRQIHDNIIPRKRNFTSISLVHESNIIQDDDNLPAPAVNTIERVPAPSISANINKNEVIDTYSNYCKTLGFTESVTTKKGEQEFSSITNHTKYPSYHQLVRDSRMKPSLNTQYRVEDLSLDNVIVIVISKYQYLLDHDDIENLSELNPLYGEMVADVMQFSNYDFAELRNARIGYESQLTIQQHRVDMATAGMIHYGLHPGMFVRYVGGEYVSESRDINQVIRDISPYASAEDVEHVRRILTQGCPSKLDYMEQSSSKLQTIRQGNHSTISDYPDIVRESMNKLDKNSQVIPIKSWILHFSPYLRHTPQSMVLKENKNPRMVWDGSTKFDPFDIVLNEITPTEFEAVIDFGTAKRRLLANIYNWRISFPDDDIYLAMEDLTSCFRIPRVAADLTGAFGFMIGHLFFLATSMVFGSNTSASSWEPFRRSIEALIPIYFNRPELVDKHRELLNQLKWNTGSTAQKTRAFRCPINTGMLNEDGTLKPVTAPIYVDDILLAAALKQYILRLLAAAIEAIFVVCGRPNIEVRQCPLSLEKWESLVVGTKQIMLGLEIDTDRMTVKITDDYRTEVLTLLQSQWNPSRRFFKVDEIQKLVGKLARLGEGAPWIYKIMSHLYTSLAAALRRNKALLQESSKCFRNLLHQIDTKQFSGTQQDIAKQVNFALKKASKMTNRYHQSYIINTTMRNELNFFHQALELESNINFETPIAFLIPRTPAAELYGDSSLYSCGGYSTKLQYWWYLSFPKYIQEHTLLYIKNDDDGSLISINCLEYVTIIINYCASVCAFSNNEMTDDPRPVVLCITDNTSVLNWTLHTCKKSQIGRALARFFCGLLIHSNVGVNAKWISTTDNAIADEISRLKVDSTNTHLPSFDTFDFSTLQQKFQDLNRCRFFQPSQELLSIIWEILLTKKCPDLSTVVNLKPQDLGKLCTSPGQEECSWQIPAGPK